MKYQTGQLLWGASKAIGNIWVVIDGPKRAIALVFNGKLKKYIDYFSQTTHDVIKPTSYLYEVTPGELVNLINSQGALPRWALDHMLLCGPAPLPSTVVNTTTLPPSVVQKVQQALGVKLTAEPERVTVKQDTPKCKSSTGEHSYTAYTGLIQSFEYCVYCDAKRDIVE